MSAIPGMSDAGPYVRPQSGSSSYGGHKAQKFLSALDVAIPQIKPPPTYGLAMAFLALCLVLLSGGYLALVAFLGWLVVWHAYQSVVTLGEGPYLIFHLPMALLGGFLLLFLVKPIFFRRRAKKDTLVTLTPGEAPLLFAFVKKLCASTGVREPAIIEVDTEPNAAARFRGGIGSLFGGGFVLRIGLPLAAALSVRQFAGVLAHEFGHFNQHSGMLGSYLIRRLNGYFATIVFHRDGLDERLEALRRKPAAASRLIYYIAVALVEPARGVLWLMLMLGELLTCGVLRRMEYDADHVEAQVAGVADFAKTNRLVVFLSIAARRARQDLAHAWEQQRLADDLPRLIVANAKQLAEHRDEIFKVIDARKTGWLDTHPCHADRVSNVQRLASAGLADCDAPAHHLFGDFKAICGRATDALYRSELEKEFEAAKLVPTEELVEEQSVQRTAGKALRRYYRGHVFPLRPVFPGPEAQVAPISIDAAVRAVRDCRQTLLAAADAARPHFEKHDDSAGVLRIARAQVELCGLFAFNAKAMKVRRKALADLDANQATHIETARQLSPFEVAASQRLTAALRILHSDAVAQTFSGDLQKARWRTAQLVVVCGSLHSVLPAITILAERAILVRVLCSAYNDQAPYQPLVKRIIQTGGEIVRGMEGIRSDLSLSPYPFAHATEGISIGNALVQKIPQADDPVQSHVTAISVVERYCSFVLETLAELAEIAERAESAVGMESLPEPAEVDNTADIKQEQNARSKDSRRYWFGYGGRAAAGLAMVSGLIWMSAFPPSLPAMPWESSRPSGGYASASAPSYRYQPASFRPTFTPPVVQSPTSSAPYTGPYRFTTDSSMPGYRGTPQNPSPGQPGVYTPPGAQRNPGSYQPPTGYQPPPGYQPPTATPPARPAPYNPRPYTPPSGGGGGGGSRSGGGGGGFSPGGGGGRR